MKKKTIKCLPFPNVQFKTKQLLFFMMNVLIVYQLTAQELAIDANTSLLLHFNNNLTDANGQMPTTSSNTTYGEGIHNEGLSNTSNTVLKYSTTNNFNAPEGTIEFWIKPNWNGNDGQHRVFFSLENKLVINKDSGNNFRFILNNDDSEAHQAINLSNWQAGEWHHIAVTWNISGNMKTYIDGAVAINHSARNQDLINPIPSNLSIGSQYNNFQSEGIIDELRISNRERTESEILQSVLAGLTIESVKILDAATLEPVTSIELMETWKRNLLIEITSPSGIKNIPLNAFDWISSNDDVALVSTTGEVKAINSGTVTLTGTYNNFELQLSVLVNAPVLAPVEETIHPYLSTTNECAIEEIPVVILRYLPTADGTNLDVTKAPDFWSLGESTLNDMETRINTFDHRVKFALEEGTKFRGYNNPDAVPYIGYKVIKYITVYETTPRGDLAYYRNGLPVYKMDYHAIFERFNLAHYINHLGVKEVWMWNAPFGPDYPSYNPNIHNSDDFRQGNESNMSSPSSGDISNSHRDNSDLPIYDHTYILYEQNLRRTQAEAVHNRGHQLEAMFSHLNYMQDGNTDLFWKKFVGKDNNNNWITGRSGWTHMPPNTTQDYNYDNTTLVDSDIEDWHPEETGEKKPINVDRWANLIYDWPGESDFSQRVESQWYLYWMQNMPGFGNMIPYRNNYLNNWWELYTNWDAAILNSKGLYANNSTVGNPNLCCPKNLTHSNTIYSNTYKVQECIYSNSIIPAGNSVVYQAGKNITLKSGFHALSGAQFLAFINNCLEEATFLETRPLPVSKINLEVNNHIELKVYPNPFSTGFTVNYQLVEPETVSIYLLDMLGRKKQIITSNIAQPPGFHQAHYQNKGLTDGVYFLVIEKEGTFSQKKLILSNH